MQRGSRCETDRRLVTDATLFFATDDDCECCTRPRAQQWRRSPGRCQTEPVRASRMLEGATRTHFWQGHRGDWEGPSVSGLDLFFFFLLSSFDHESDETSLSLLGSRLRFLSVCAVRKVAAAREIQAASRSDDRGREEALHFSAAQRKERAHPLSLQRTRCASSHKQWRDLGV